MAIIEDKLMQQFKDELVNKKINFNKFLKHTDKDLKNVNQKVKDKVFFLMKMSYLLGTIEK